MISEKLIQTRYRYPAVIAFTGLFMYSGFMAGKEKYTEALLLLISGLVIVMMIMGSFDRINRSIAFFFNALRNSDTSLQFPVKIGNKTLAMLYDSMNRLNSHFQAIKLQNEYNENYYKALIHHSASGLLVLNRENQVELINQIACKYAGVPADSTNLKLLGIKNPAFLEAMCRLKPGEDIVYKHVLGSEYHLLTFRATLLRKDDKELKLISINDIRHEMEAREIDSYKKLISVLTHEIMNLVSPLTSVSTSLQALYDKPDGDISMNDINEDVVKTTQTGLRLINEHSIGLTRFIETYRKISRIPKPVIRPFSIDEWVEQMNIVFGPQMAGNDIGFQIIKDNKIKEVSADKSLLNQVILNLVNNAVDAVLETSTGRQVKIDFSDRPDMRLRITVTNNGSPIPAEILDKIFVPFFTTKQNGSGIGLSICQEIIRLHKGSLTVLSPAGGPTSFIIEL